MPRPCHEGMAINMAGTKSATRATTGKMRIRIKKGDQVVVTAGRSKGKRGRVLEIDAAGGRAKVEGAAKVKKHQKASAKRAGGILDTESFISISNVQLIDPDSGRPTRVRYRVSEDGAKVRVAVRSGSALERA
ncbi:MAG: 50S ribosomal protein L24 [Pyrinomonadaceae bacterium]